MSIWQERISRLVQQRAGLVLSESTKQRLDSFVARRCVSLGISAPESYVRILETEQLAAEFQEILNIVTVSKTAFFRYPKHIDAICGHLLPALDALLDVGAPIHIWSAAVSSGEEPYSLAMALEHAAWFTRRPITLLGTDINDVSLARARKGEYHLDDATRSRLPDYAWRYLEAVPGTQRHRISERLRARVEFARANLNALALRSDRAFHVVLCCNVLIYFDELNRQRVISDIQARMADHAALLLGGAEITAATDPSYRVQNVAGCFVHLHGRWEGLSSSGDREPSAAPAAVAGPAAAPTATAQLQHEPSAASSRAQPAAESGDLVAARRPKSERRSSAESAAARLVPEPTRWRARVRLLLDANQFDEACRVLDAVREQDPFCEEVHYLYGQALRELGRLDEAEGAFRRAVFLDPDFSLARYELGLLRHQQGDFAAALREYQRVLAALSGRRLHKSQLSAGRELEEAAEIEKFMEQLCLQNRELALVGLLPGAASPIPRAPASKT
jgi:chemotaxis methyl-accepting protein methylase/Tfp pilus assembly protein PilF